MRQPFLTYHRLSADGQLITNFPVQVPGPTMTHDFAITKNHIVWLDLPVVFDMELVGHGMPYQWSDKYTSRIGLMARTTRSSSGSTWSRATCSTWATPARTSRAA